jgi:hypothetical protein
MIMITIGILKLFPLPFHSTASELEILVVPHTNLMQWCGESGLDRTQAQPITLTFNTGKVLCVYLGSRPAQSQQSSV